MPDVMMLSREVKRVPLDFDWPLKKLWKGFIMPEEFRPPRCEICGPASEAAGRPNEADGLSPFARQLMMTWYSLHVPWNQEGIRAAATWNDKIGQHEVDALIEHHRLDPVIDCPKGCKTPEARGWVRGSGESWKTDCPECGGKGWTRHRLKPGDLTPEQVNAGVGLSPFGHDSINAHIIIKARCELLGFPYLCEWCEGSERGGLDEQYLRAHCWVPYEPPEGEGYQLWESITEGSPISPVFNDTRMLARWLAENENLIGKKLSFEEWLEVIGGEVLGTEVRTGALV